MISFIALSCPDHISLNLNGFQPFVESHWSYLSPWLWSVFLAPYISTQEYFWVVFWPHGHTFTFFIYIVVMDCQILADAMSAHHIYSKLLLTYSSMVYLPFFMRMKNKLNLIVLLWMPNMPPSHQPTRLCTNFIFHKRTDGCYLISSKFC